ncbi:MAG: acyltransferase [Lawsonibacter sp.]|nr:acyltransferase [Lawsonibacter sp.]
MKYHVLSKYRTELMGMAIIWVMLFHAYDLDLGHWALNWFRAAGFGGVDIFILLSSMGLVMSLSRREQEYGEFMSRRLSRLLPAYYAVMIPYTLFFILYYDAPWSALIWNSLLLYYWVRPAGYFNWYVAGALTFYSVTPLCFRLMRRSRHRELVTGAGVLLGLLASQMLMQDGFWNMLDIMYRVPLFFLGLLMGFYIVEDRRLDGKSLLFWCIWFGLGLVYLRAMSWEQELVFLPQCHLFVFTTVPMCLTACWCFEHLPLGWLRKFLRLMGTYSLEIYLLNVSLFAEIPLLRQLVSFGPSNRLYFLLAYAVNIAMGILLHKLVERLRLLWERRTRTPLAV